MTGTPKTSSKIRYLRALLASTALVSTGAVHGQTDAVAPTPDSQSESIEEIVVRGIARRFRPDDQRTATGLDISLIETPQSVSVLTPEMLNTINADSAYDATDLVPGMQRSGYGFGIQRIILRGIVDSDRRANGILLGGGLTEIQSYATERIEIVRGPATALYGVTGSFGGEINNILKKPLDTPRMQLGASIGSYDSRDVYTDITGPLLGEGAVSGRLVAKYNEYDLPLDIPGESFPNYETTVLAAVNWDITEQTSLSFSYYHYQRNTDPWDGGALFLNSDDALVLPDVDPEQWYFSHPDQSTETMKGRFALVELQHEFNNGWRSDTQLAWNKAEEDLSYFFPFGPFGAYSLADDEIYIYSYDIEHANEELTFKQSLGGDFEMLGREHQLFMALEYSEDLEPARFALLNSAFMGYARVNWFTEGVYDGETPRFTDGSAFEPFQGNREDILGVRQVLLGESDDLKFSAQVLLNPTDRLSLLAGAIYHKQDTVNTVPFNRGSAVTPPTVTEISFSEQVYRFGATYDVIDELGFIDDARIYYSYSEGFQPQTIIDADGIPVSAPREMVQHEVGIKAEMLGGAAGASLALLDYEITNIAVSSEFLGSFGGFGSSVLEGKQKVTGLEAELVGEVFPGFNVLANYTWMDAEIANPNNLRSTPLRGTPEHSGAITATYEFLQGTLEGLRIGTTLKASGDYAFVTGTSNIDRWGPLLEAGSHQRVDLNVMYAPRSGALQNFELFFNWNNIFEEDIIMPKESHPGFGIMFIDQSTMTLGVRYTTE
jgi:iron complex outermembrane recepter protein